NRLTRLARPGKGSREVVARVGVVSPERHGSLELNSGRDSVVAFETRKALIVQGLDIIGIAIEHSLILVNRFGVLAIHQKKSRKTAMSTSIFRIEINSTPILGERLASTSTAFQSCCQVEVGRSRLWLQARNRKKVSGRPFIVANFQVEDGDIIAH